MFRLHYNFNHHWIVTINLSIYKSRSRIRRVETMKKVLRFFRVFLKVKTYNEVGGSIEIKNLFNP